MLLTITSLLISFVFFIQHKSGRFTETRACLVTSRTGQLCSERGTSASGAATLHPGRMRPAASSKGTPERGGVYYKSASPPACNQTHPPWQGSPQGGGGRGGGGGGDGEDGGHPGAHLPAG